MSKNTSTNTTSRDPFEFGGAPAQIEVTVNGITRPYLVRDIPYIEAVALFRAVRDEAGNPVEDPEHAAKLISTAVLRADGSSITLDEAKGFRFQLVQQLVPQVMKTLTGSETGDADGDGGEGNGPSEETL